MKKVFLYCHDTLAFGHISRMLNIYHVLSQDHDVYMIFGGKVPEKHVQDKNYISLPILQEKDIFENPKISSKILQDRKKILQRSIGVHKPDTLLIDYFPFGRIALKDEIEEIIKYIKEYKQEAKIYTFMRDIFHASSTLDRQEYEWVKESILDFFGYPYSYMIKKYYDTFHLYFTEGIYRRDIFLNFMGTSMIHSKTWENLCIEYYFESGIIDACIIFGDSNTHELKNEFVFSEKTQRQFISLGYLLPQGRKQILLQKEDYILISFGGAIFDYDVYIEVVQKISSSTDIHIKCIVPFFKDEKRMKEISKIFSTVNIEFIPFREDFYILHQHAKACVMGGGYGSFMDLLYHPIPALIVLNHNKEVAINETEQYQRYAVFQKYLPILLYEKDMNSEQLIDFLLNNDTSIETIKKINTKGAENLCKLFK